MMPIVLTIMMALSSHSILMLLDLLLDKVLDRLTVVHSISLWHCIRPTW